MKRAVSFVLYYIILPHPLGLAVCDPRLRVGGMLTCHGQLAER